MPLKESERKRAMWADPEVFDLLKGNKTGVHFPSIKADVLIGQFCKGLMVSVSREQSSRAEYKWFKGHDEVWAWSFRSPAPGWRILGRFARKNVFVALAAHDRHALADMATYNAIAAGLPAQWERKFPGVAPYRGTDFSDYVGEMHVER